MIRHDFTVYCLFLSQPLQQVGDDLSDIGEIYF